MLQSMASQKVRYDLATEQNRKIIMLLEKKKKKKKTNTNSTHTKKEKKNPQKGMKLKRHISE